MPTCVRCSNDVGPGRHIRDRKNPVPVRVVENINEPTVPLVAVMVIVPLVVPAISRKSSPSLRW